MWLTRLAINRPVVIWMALAALAILGIISYSRLPTELNPQVDIPTLTVTTIYPGAGPQEIEALVTRPLEDAVGSVAGVKDVFSSSQGSVSIVSLDFALGIDLDKTAASLREKVEGARPLLPPEARAPIVAKLDINAQPVLYMALVGSASIRDLRDKVDRIVKPQLARVPGVASVNIVGGEQREIRVEADARRLEQYGITVGDLVTSIKAANANVPGGSITQGRREIGVRTLGAFTKAEDIRDTQVLAPQLMAMSPAALNTQHSTLNTPLTIGDVATVIDSVAPATEFSRVNGKDSIGIIITRASNANTVAVVDAVKESMGPILRSLPDTSVTYSRDDSIMVRDALEDVDATLVLGALLAMTVVLLFLHNFRGTLIVFFSLPACLVATFIVMYFASFTLNQMTLLALSLSVGILIDDSIVVLENITRHLGRGETPEEAAFNGRTEIGFANVAITLVDVVVFLPIAFMGGIVGAFFRQFGMTIVVATLFSLIVSFTVVPSLASRWYRFGEDPERSLGVFAGLERFYLAIGGFYRRVIVLALANRGWVVLTAAVALASTLLVTVPSLGTELLPATDQGQVVVTVELPSDSSLASTDGAAREIERKLAGAPDVQNYVVTVGELLGGFGSFPQRGPQYAQVNVRLVDKESLLDRIIRFGGPTGRRKRPDTDVVADIRRRLVGIAGPRITVSAVRTVANIGPPIQLQLRGANLDDLNSVAAQVRDRMKSIPGILDPDISSRVGKPELKARIDRVRASALGVPPAQVGAALRDAVEGNTDSTLRAGGTEIPIRVQLAGVDRNEPEDLGSIVVGSSGGRAVTLSEVADLTQGAGPVEIDRINGQRMVTLTANLDPGYPLSSAEADIRQRMADISLQGIAQHFSGESEAMDENIPYFVMALGLAVVLVYLVMASLFNSLLNPFIIMFTLPMALVGALGALALSGESISLVSMIGIIMLTGLMGRNAILLIDYTGTLRARGMERNQAVAEAGATRLRPILMTTLATIFGMLPVALRIGRASELRAPMAIVVIGGLLLSTVLTLIVIPSLYTIFDDLRARLTRGRIPKTARTRKDIKAE